MNMERKSIKFFMSLGERAVKRTDAGGETLYFNYEMDGKNL